MATHCSILAWKIQWAEEPGRLQSIGLPRCGHNWASELSSSHYCSLLYYCYRSIYKTLLITKQQFYQTEKSPMCTLLILKQCDIKCTGNHEKKRELQIEYWFTPNRSTEASSQPTNTWEVINNCCFNLQIGRAQGEGSMKWWGRRGWQWYQAKGAVPAEACRSWDGPGKAI